MDPMETEKDARQRAMLERMPKDLIYQVTVEQAISACFRGLSIADPPLYNFVEGGGGETRWIDIYKEKNYLGRFTFTRKPTGTLSRLTSYKGPETRRITLMGLLDYHLKEMEDEVGASEEIEKTISEPSATDADRATKAGERSKGGRHGHGTKAEKIQAVRDWDAIDPFYRPRLEDWLDTRFGSTGAVPNVAVRTFHGWRKYLKN